MSQKERPQNKTNPADILISDSWPPELRESCGVLLWQPQQTNTHQNIGPKAKTLGKVASPERKR